MSNLQKSKSTVMMSLENGGSVIMLSRIPYFENYVSTKCFATFSSLMLDSGTASGHLVFISIIVLLLDIGKRPNISRWNVSKRFPVRKR